MGSSKERKRKSARWSRIKGLNLITRNEPNVHGKLLYLADGFLPFSPSVAFSPVASQEFITIYYAMGIGGASFVKALFIDWLCCPCFPGGTGCPQSFVQSIKKWLSPLSRAVRSTYHIRH